MKVLNHDYDALIQKENSYLTIDLYMVLDGDYAKVTVYNKDTKETENLSYYNDNKGAVKSFKMLCGLLNCN